MSLNMQFSREQTDLIIDLLNRLNNVMDQSDINEKMFELKNQDYILEMIYDNGNIIKGTFKRNRKIIPIYITRIEVNEEILMQLSHYLNEYNQYISNLSANLQPKQYQKLVDINSGQVNWQEVFNTSIYAQIFLNTAIELLYLELNRHLNR
ncbi:MAG: hypothetical protein ACFFBP_15260 [Promethearchaeota archaeon]